MKSYPVSREIARMSGSNFYLSFFFLPREKRNGILAIYAFSRLVDDAVDEAPSEEEARRQIDFWRSRLNICFHGGVITTKDTIFHPVLPEFSDTIRRFKIPEKYFSDLLLGVEMDLTKKRYETFSELETYCYHVAGTIGLLCNHLFGVSEEKGRDYALLLGTAFQLTNIIRDVGSDARRGRIYIPREEWTRFGLTETDILEGKSSKPFLNLMRFQAERAESYFQKAFEALSEEQRRKIIPAEIMAAFYHTLLQKLQKERFPVFEKKVALSKWKKLKLVIRALRRSRGTSP